MTSPHEDDSVASGTAVRDGDGVAAAPENLSIPTASEALEKHLIAAALRQTGGNKSKAARLLDISERSLWYKLTRYDLG